MTRFLRQDCHQDGSALIVTLLVMASLALFGIMSLNTLAVEFQIGRNEKELRQAFYLAEAGAWEGVQRLTVLTHRNLDEQASPWHHAAKSLRSEAIDFRDPTDWHALGEGQGNALVSGIAPDTYTAAVEYAVATGGSLISTDSRLYLNRVYGLCTRFGTDQVIEIGYYLRY